MGPDGAIVRFLKSNAQEDARLRMQQSSTGLKENKVQKDKVEATERRFAYAAGRRR